MDLRLTAGEAEFRDALRAWLQEHVPEVPLVAGEDETFELRLRWQRALHEAGYAGLSWPQEFGGAGAPLTIQAIFDEETALANAPHPANMIGLSNGGPALIKHGSEFQKGRFLKPILSGDEIWCQGFSEPGAGSDLAAVKTRADRTEGGWIVNGQKVWTSLGHRAQWCILIARTDPAGERHHGLSFFAMPMDAEGITLRPLKQITGDAEFNEMFLEDVFIEDNLLVGEEGQGWAVAMTTLVHERATVAIRFGVGARQALDRLVGELRKSGYGSDPVVRSRVAELHIGLETLRLGTLRAISVEEKTGVPGSDSSLAKWQWSELSQGISELAVDVFGPEALVEGSGWAYDFLESRAHTIYGGTTDVQRNIIARRLLGLPG